MYKGINMLNYVGYVIALVELLIYLIMKKKKGRR